MQTVNQWETTMNKRERKTTRKPRTQMTKEKMWLEKLISFIKQTSSELSHYLTWVRLEIRQLFREGLLLMQVPKYIIDKFKFTFSLQTLIIKFDLIK